MAMKVTMKQATGRRRVNAMAEKLEAWTIHAGSHGEKLETKVDRRKNQTRADQRPQAGARTHGGTEDGGRREDKRKGSQRVG